ncbi:hypothetical protein [Flindersiella endophytica]
MRKSRWPAATSDADFEPYLADLPPDVRRMFGRFVELARSCGPTTFELQNGPIVLCGSRRIFASVTPRADWLAGHLVLAREVEDARFTKVEPLTKRLYFHAWRIGSAGQLDDSFAALLDEAHAVGDGDHLRTPRG